MSIQLVLLKSGEEVIADVKELRDDSYDLLSYVFKDPYTIKIKTAQVLMEGKGSPKHEAIYYTIKKGIVKIPIKLLSL